MLLPTTDHWTRSDLRVAIVMIATLVIVLGYSAGSGNAALVPCDDPRHAAQVLCPACESTGTCTISGTWDVPNVPPTGCSIDFDDCSVVLTGTLRSASTDGGKFNVFAGDLTLRGGKLLATGTNGGEGGWITVTTRVGRFRMDGGSPLVDVDGDAGVGTIAITAATAIEIATGTITGNGTALDATAGDVSLSATAGLVVDGQISAAATAPGDGSSGAVGGTITLDGGSIDISKRVDVSSKSGDGGQITITATNTTITIRSTATLDAKSGNVLDDDHELQGGTGGTIELDAPGDVLVEGGIDATGAASNGSGGIISVNSDDGTVTTRAIVTAEGKGTASDGGQIAFSALSGDMHIEANVVASGGIEGVDGYVGLFPNIDLTIAASRSVTVHGGTIETESRGTLHLLGTLDVSGRSGQQGGSVRLGPHCRIDVPGTADTRGGAGGHAGKIDVEATVVTLTSTTKLLATPCAPPPPPPTYVCSTLPPAPPSCIVVTTKSGTVVQPSGADVEPPWYVQSDSDMHACCGNGTVDADAGEICDDGDTLSCDGRCSLRCDGPDRCADDGGPLDDGDPCTGTQCSETVGCEALTGPACASDGNPCTADVCQQGICVHTAMCDGTTDDPCRSGRCDPVLGCQFENAPDGTPCPGNACTTNQCEAGACVSVALAVCDDGDPCTTDACDVATGVCTATEAPEACPCVVGDTPVPAGTRCVDGNDCSVGETCDGAGACKSGHSIFCSDDNPCTYDNCFSEGCVHAEFACSANCAGQTDGTYCSDGDPCTIGTCVGGVCQSTPVACSDGEVCVTVCEFGYRWTAGCRVAPQRPSATSPTRTPTVTATPTRSPTLTPTPSPTLTPTASPTATPTDTATPEVTSTATPTPEPLDHFTCYKAAPSHGSVPFQPRSGVALDDELGGASTVTLRKPRTLCAPADVNGDDPAAPSHAEHLEGYQLKRETAVADGAYPTNWRVSDRFNPNGLVVDVRRPSHLLVPTAKDRDATPPTPSAFTLDHFECYQVRVSAGTPKFAAQVVTTVDQFSANQLPQQPIHIVVTKPRYLCSPTDVNGLHAPGNAGHLMCYRIKQAEGPKLAKTKALHVANEFGAETLDAIKQAELCVPAVPR